MSDKFEEKYGSVENEKSREGKLLWYAKQQAWQAGREQERKQIVALLEAGANRRKAKALAGFKIPLHEYELLMKLIDDIADRIESEGK
ncbi:hypothetical protein ACFL3R_00675 [Thermodesulfobacteriota bacterium]